MYPFIDVRFQELPADQSIESAVHRWVARLVAQDIDVLGATMRISRAGRRRTTARLALIVSGGKTPTAEVAGADPYVAVADAFRAARRQVLETAPAANRLHAMARAG